MPVTIQGQVGPQILGDGAQVPLRSIRSGEVAVSEVHGRFYEQNFRGAMFSAGMAVTSISNATFGAAGLANTTTPIVGVWNVNSSTVNLVILQAALAVSQTALQATGGGGFVWAMSTGNTALTLGAAPLNRKTLALSGSSAKDMSGAALTGVTNVPTVRFASSMGGGSAIGAAFLATQAGAQTVQATSFENFDGNLIVPPGGLLVLLNATTPVGHSAASMLLWEEVPV